MAKAKEYKFEVHSLIESDSYNIAAYYTKGHHDTNQFVEAIKKEYGVKVNPDWVNHSYGMFVPYAGKKITLLTEFKEPTKRCFPVTYIDI